MKENILEFLKEQYFIPIPFQIPQFDVLYKPEQTFINIIIVMSNEKEGVQEIESFQRIQNTVKKYFEERTDLEVHILSLLLADDVKKVKSIAEYDNHSWIIDTNNERLVIFENQISEFYGLRERLEFFMQFPQTENSLEEPKRSIGALINIILIAINVIIFILCTFTGELLYNKGALAGYTILANGEYYRFLTSTFLHADINHLLNNMLLLYFAGEVMEKHIGHIKYLFLYILSGLGGSLLSVFFQIYFARYSSSIGASGAVFGIIGALLYLVIRHRGRLQYITIGKMLFLIIYSLYSGFRATNIDNAGHVGGLLAGILVMIIYHMVENIRRNKLRLSIQMEDTHEN